MINFKTIEISDKKEIDKCLAGNTFRASDYCFTNLLAWKERFSTMFAIEKETLFTRFKDIDGYLCYMMPIGKLPLEKSIKLILDDAKENNIPVRMKGITRRMWICIEKAMPGMFNYIHDRDSDEYIYLTEKMISLKGKKLQSKRNHINRFKAENPDWEYFTITNTHELNECLKMLIEWEEINTEKNGKSLRYDYLASKAMLENFHELQLCGGAIRVNGKIVAFSVGEKLTDDTFVVHLEKAFGSMNGAYAIINQQFAEHEAIGYEYINREEDLGLENLRQAKMSYYPDILLQERVLTLIT
ncbi:MAG: phosphatidylglycerol lysyltransferase domain-containing protein [Bacteroidales bacterium]|jgi:hypothetical protein|nr:phosphatidylglycerol lysyltransferase domain-containing protein [Bacteroidales bacterium]